MSETKWAPGPYDWEASKKPGGAGGSSGFNVYVTDANGRKIAAVWGKINGEKEATTQLFVAAPEMFEALAGMLPFFEEDFPDGPDGFCAATPKYRAAYKAVLAAMARARGEDA